MNDTTNNAGGHGVVVTGMAVIDALGADTETVWKAVRDGRTGIGLTCRLDVSALTCHYSGEVAEVPQPRQRPRGRLDRASRLALAAAEQAITSADLSLSEVDSYRAGVALGTSVGGLDQGERFHWELLRGGVQNTRSDHLLTYPLYTCADAISVAHGLRGPKVVISNACAAGGNSLGWAADAIRRGRADVMIAGGVDVLDILSFAGFDSLKALDSGPCAPLSRSDGLNLGEGAAVLVLESETVARQRQAEILAHLLGYGLSSDAHHATAPDPAGDGARRAMTAAISQSGLHPGEIDYVNAHGTGTPANDDAEPRAVDSVFGPAPPPMSSTKSQIGHTLGAAGAIEAAVSTLALRDGVLPPTVNVSGSPARDIVPGTGRSAAPRSVLSNSFAFGGNNCALLLGRSARPAQPDGQRADRRVVISGAGVVSPLGHGRHAFVDAVARGDVSIGEATVDLSSSRTGLAAQLHDQGYRKQVNRSYARRLDQLGTIVMAACRMALTDAGHQTRGPEAERTGMVFGTFTGPMETVANLTETIQRSGPERVSPRLFPNSVMNAAAGHACLALQVRGPLSTLASGCTSGVTGLGYAADLIRDGKADTMLAVSADELTPLLHLGFDRLNLLADSRSAPYRRQPTGAVLGAGGAALVVESLEHARARGAPILAEVTGHAVTSDAHRVAGNDPSGQAWAQSMARAVDEAGLQAADVGAVYGDARGTSVLDVAEARAVNALWEPGSVPVANLAGQLGHVHSTSPLLSAVCATRTAADGWVPPVRGSGGEPGEPLPEAAAHDLSGRAHGSPADGCGSVVTAANWGGTYASVVIAPLRADEAVAP